MAKKEKEIPITWNEAKAQAMKKYIYQKNVVRWDRDNNAPYPYIGDQDDRAMYDRYLHSRARRGGIEEVMIGEIAILRKEINEMKAMLKDLLDGKVLEIKGAKI